MDGTVQNKGSEQSGSSMDGTVQNKGSEHSGSSMDGTVQNKGSEHSGSSMDGTVQNKGSEHSGTSGTLDGTTSSKGTASDNHGQTMDETTQHKGDDGTTTATPLDGSTQHKGSLLETSDASGGPMQCPTQGNNFDTRFAPDSNGVCSLATALSGTGLSSVSSICAKPLSVQLETGTAVIYPAGVYVTFTSSFATAPVVIVTPTIAGIATSQAMIQITQVQPGGFSAKVVGTQLGTRGKGSPPPMNVSYMAVTPGSGRLGRMAQGARIQAGVVKTSEYTQACSSVGGSCKTVCADKQGSADAGEMVSYVPAFGSPPALLTQLQTANNPNALGVSAAQNTDMAAFAIELGTSSGGLSQHETIGWIAIETGGSSFIDNNGNGVFLSAALTGKVGTPASTYIPGSASASLAQFDVSQQVGYPIMDGKEYHTPLQPPVPGALPWTVFASKTTRNDPRGGIVRLVSSSSAKVSVVIDSDDSVTCPKSTLYSLNPDTIAIVAFSNATRLG